MHPARRPPTPSTPAGTNQPGGLNLGPFTALIVIIPMLLGVQRWPDPRRRRPLDLPGRSGPVVIYGDLPSGRRIIRDMPLSPWHPGCSLRPWPGKDRGSPPRLTLR